MKDEERPLASARRERYNERVVAVVLLALATVLMTALTVVNVVGFVFRPGLVPLSAAIVGAAGATLAGSALRRAWHERADRRQ